MHVHVFQTGIIFMFGYRPEYSLWKEALRSANSYLLQLSGITEDIWDRKPMLLIRVIFRDAFQEKAIIFLGSQILCGGCLMGSCVLRPSLVKK